MPVERKEDGMIALAVLVLAQACAVGFACLLFTGGEPWQEHALEPMPSRVRLVRWPLPAKPSLN
ncbi:hypothetical protein HYZ80_01540 [Candidatus Parcubacteria bacterium]|nr:hypothetical protein [Candidatus Parcubacteria bacterium]